MRSAARFAQSFKCPVLMPCGSGEGGSEAAVRLTAERARAVGLDARRGVVEGDHNSTANARTTSARPLLATRIAK
jgi:hypothetical protein